MTTQQQLADVLGDALELLDRIYDTREIPQEIRDRADEVITAGLPVLRQHQNESKKGRWIWQAA